MPVFFLSAALIAIPWLWPFTYGPVAAVLPYLASVTFAALSLTVLGLRQDTVSLWSTISTSWLVAAVVSAVIGLLQYFDVEAALHPWVNIAAPGQAFGNLRQPNQLATLLVIGLLALRWLYMKGRVKPPLATALAGLLATGLAATASRIGITELVVLGVLLIWWAWRKGRVRVALGVFGATFVLYVVAALALPELLQLGEGVTGRSMVDRLQHAESTCGSRLILWGNVLDLIREKPWTGWGWGNLAYAHYTTLYDGSRFCHILDNAHNLPLHVAVELGVPAAVLFCGAITWLLWCGKPWAETELTRQLAWGVLLAIGLHSLVEYPLWYGPFQIAVALCIWMLWATRRRPKGAESYGIESKEKISTFSAHGLRLTVAALMLSAVAYAGWDYHRISQIYLPYEERSSWYRDDAMGYAKRSWLFADAVRFAEVTTRPATRENAKWMLSEALRALHFSPEARVITKVIESAALLSLDDLALRHMARFKAAFPAEYRQWVGGNRQIVEGARELNRQGVMASTPP